MADEINDNEIQIDKKKLGFKSIIKLNLKTVLWILGGLWFIFSFLFTVGYFDIKSDMKKNKIEFYMSIQKDVKTELIEVKSEIKDKNNEIENVKDDISDIKGDVKVILDRTMRNNDHNSTGHVSDDNSATTTMPTNIPVVENREHH